MSTLQSDISNLLLKNILTYLPLLLRLLNILKCLCGCRYGRRLSTIVYHIAAGVPLAIVMFIPQTVGNYPLLTSNALSQLVTE